MPRATIASRPGPRRRLGDRVGLNVTDEQKSQAAVLQRAFSRQFGTDPSEAYVLRTAVSIGFWVLESHFNLKHADELPGIVAAALNPRRRE